MELSGEKALLAPCGMPSMTRQVPLSILRKLLPDMPESLVPLNLRLLERAESRYARTRRPEVRQVRPRVPVENVVTMRRKVSSGQTAGDLRQQTSVTQALEEVASGGG